MQKTAIEAVLSYSEAKKSGIKQYSQNLSRGMNGNLPSLEDLLINTEIIKRKDLGTLEIPLKKIVGTYAFSRSISFASNFMPILDSKSEFGMKWIFLSESQLEEGIKYPIKVYEYMNFYYVVEGNKRVSVLKYFNAYSVRAEITRLIPKYDANNLINRIYYEFLDFNNKTGINCIWFTKELNFMYFYDYIRNYKSEIKMNEQEKYKSFLKDIYFPFRRVLHEFGENEFSFTTGDALLEFIWVYGFPSPFIEEDIRRKLKIFLKEIEYYLYLNPDNTEQNPVYSGKEHFHNPLTNIIKSRKKINVAFVYEQTPSTSRWDLLHDNGRKYLESIMGDYVKVQSVENIPVDIAAYDDLKKLAKSGNNIIFTTSPNFLNATLRAAMEFRNVRFLNCSESFPFKHVGTYFGRIHEAKFLTGIIAGIMTKTNVLGYIVGNKGPNIIREINAFTLGAKMVNPEVKVIVEWSTNFPLLNSENNICSNLTFSGADIISYYNSIPTNVLTDKYGLYSVVSSTGKEKCNAYQYIAAPVWNWGRFYEKIVKNIIDSIWNPFTGGFKGETKLKSYWWCMDAGVIDISFSEELVPKETQKMIKAFKNMIVHGMFTPFTGPIFDNKGSVRIEAGREATLKEIINMEWYVDGISE